MPNPTNCGVFSLRCYQLKPTSAFETPQAIQDLCTAYHQAVKDDIYDPLLLSGLFILDFL
ncbi:hypothetical protein [Lonepinella koalarum]|uniref:hypothetical protein n=1 Tax=Lonepinella koalarum TaxID=53417 RepID=UPI003F6DFB5E